MSGGAPDVVLAERTGASCAVASWRGRLHLAWTGSDMAGQRQNETVLAWTGTDRHLLTLRRGAAAAPVRLDATTSCSPALCRHLDALVLAWTGADGRPNLLFSPV